MPTQTDISRATTAYSVALNELRVCGEEVERAADAYAIAREKALIAVMNVEDRRRNLDAVVGELSVFASPEAVAVDLRVEQTPSPAPVEVELPTTRFELPANEERAIRVREP